MSSSRTGLVMPWFSNAAASLGQVVLDLVCLHPCLTPRVPLIAIPASGRETVLHLPLLNLFKRSGKVVQERSEVGKSCLRQAHCLTKIWMIGHIGETMATPGRTGQSHEGVTRAWLYS